MWAEVHPFSLISQISPSKRSVSNLPTVRSWYSDREQKWPLEFCAAWWAFTRLSNAVSSTQMTINNCLACGSIQFWYCTNNVQKMLSGKMLCLYTEVPAVGKTSGNAADCFPPFVSRERPQNPLHGTYLKRRLLKFHKFWFCNHRRTVLLPSIVPNTFTFTLEST